MNDQNVLQGEKYPHKIGAEFDSQQGADAAVRTLMNRLGLPQEQIRIVQPDDANMSRKIEPEVKGIASTLARSHIALGLGGLILGLVVAALLTSIGPAITRSSPLMTFIALGFLFPVLGLLLAGALSLRPDHDRLVNKTRIATASGRWTVIVHCASQEEQGRVKETIDCSVQTF
tara:strand:+ start:2860 stop:3381 length:522 start_codon:yes stop_codon:yes gene_type:complete